MNNNMVLWLVLGVFVPVIGAAPRSHPSFVFLLVDDIGWADFGYNGGIASTPNIDKLSRDTSTVTFMDFHSGGTVCSPTRATVLTGRNHFRDCVDYVYDCSDMTECVPHFNFAPNRTFTVPMALRDANANYKSMFTGKWHLGSFYNDSEKYGGITSSPITHGFDFFNATVEVAPTATPNCNCKKEWQDTCIYGHDEIALHCNGENDGPTGNRCCFNYWAEDDSRDHGVRNLTTPVPQDDTLYLTSVFEDFITSINDQDPFFIEVAFHNCHIPYVGTPEARQACKEGRTCKPGNYTSFQLDYFACLTELDTAIGRVMKVLEDRNRRNDTMLWLASDNGPEGFCYPVGYCDPLVLKYAPGSAGVLKGRKRDIWEAGHRVPGLVSYPDVVKENVISWQTVVTMDFMATVLDVLNMSRPESQQDWAFDGRSVLPILRDNTQLPERGLGWMYQDPDQRGFRYGKWKLVNNTKSCLVPECVKPLLYDLEADLGETKDVSDRFPEVFEAIKANMTAWLDSINHSRKVEQGCGPYNLNSP